MKPMNAILLSFFLFLGSIVFSAVVIIKEIDLKGMDNYVAVGMAVCFVFFVATILQKHRLASDGGIITKQ